MIIVDLRGILENWRKIEWCDVVMFGWGLVLDDDMMFERGNLVEMWFLWEWKDLDVWFFWVFVLVFIVVWMRGVVVGYYLSCGYDFYGCFYFVVVVCIICGFFILDFLDFFLCFLILMVFF